MNSRPQTNHHVFLENQNVLSIKFKTEAQNEMFTEQLEVYSVYYKANLTLVKAHQHTRKSSIQEMC